MMKPEILNAYTRWLEKYGKRPATLQAFAAEMGVSEAEIKGIYPTIRAIERAAVLQLWDKMQQILTSSAEFAAYGFREKILAVFFTWTEILGDNRPWLVFLHRYNRHWMAETETNFSRLLQQIVSEGKSTREVADRLLLSRWNDSLLWWQLQQVTHFWLSDRSENHEQTDVLIEKSVNFWADLMQPNLADSAFDLGRWLWSRQQEQSRL